MLLNLALASTHGIPPVFKWAKAWTRRAPAVPLRFPTAGLDPVRDPLSLEQEQLDGFATSQYYPINMGDVLASKYQVIWELGFGTASTVWLARNLM